MLLVLFFSLKIENYLNNWCFKLIMVKEKVLGETPNEKFKRIASKRTNNILKDLRILGNCSNSSVYEYSYEEVKKIFNTIEKEVAMTKQLFEKKQVSNKKFEL
jgi:hypothetical protein